ncbi:MAG: hypothetical protein HYY50_05810 [Candidatus Kerfeldbacteria bacterium]|nr:hypothetical protein [Candidatus Kerfeldbacteria bacterium]
MIKVLIVVMLWLGITSQSFAQGRTPTLPPRAQTFEELLASPASDLVVTGTVLTAVEKPRGYAGGCGYGTDLSVLPVTDIDIRVGRVIFGVAEDSVVNVTILDQGFGYLIGKEVVVWAHRTCQDAMRLRGWMGVIESDGLIGHGNGRPVFKVRSGRWEPRMPSSRLESPSLTGRQHSTGLFNGVGGIAMARVVTVEPWSEHGSVYHVQGLGWLVGNGEVIPTDISFPREALCYPHINAGDSLLVPVRLNGRDARLTLPACPTALRVRDGFAPGLGVPIANLDRALQQVGSTWWLRTFQRRGP